MRGTEYAELVAFVAVAEEHSFRRAAARLRLSPSTLSHMVRDLEDRLGARLLNRTTRSLAPTDAGAALLGKISPAFEEIAAAVDAVRTFNDRPSGTVRVNLPRAAAEVIFAPASGRFGQEYPAVQLELTIDDGFVDTVASGYDAGVRLGEFVERDMVAVRLTPDLRFAVVGSPDYFASRSRPMTPHDLRDHACINHRLDRSGALFRWRFAKGSESYKMAVEGPITTNDLTIGLTAAIEGAGLIRTLEAQVARHVEAGRLVQVLEDWCPSIPASSSTTLAVATCLPHCGRWSIFSGLRANDELSARMSTIGVGRQALLRRVSDHLLGDGWAAKLVFAAVKPRPTVLSCRPAKAAGVLSPQLQENEEVLRSSPHLWSALHATFRAGVRWSANAARSPSLSPIRQR